jgi:hypothetical protein
MLKSITLALAAALSAAAAFAADPPAPSGTQRAQPEKQQRICRGAQRSLGSHILTPRRCRTAEQWQAEDEAKAPPLALQVTEGQNDGRAPATPQ